MKKDKNRSGEVDRATAWAITGILVFVVAAMIIAGAYSSNSNSSSSSQSGFVATTVPPITASDWKEGNPNAKVSLIEYGDFECPACGEYAPIMQQLLTQYGGKVLFVFRNFPLYSIHPFAGISAQAAEAAGLLGGPSKYWAMHDLLYQKQTEWSTNPSLTPAEVTSQFLNGYAQSIGLSVGQFDTALNATSVLDKIQADVQGGNAAQIDHTPTFFVNLTQIPNPTSLQDFESVLNAAIASSSASGAGNASSSGA